MVWLRGDPKDSTYRNRRYRMQGQRFAVKHQLPLAQASSPATLPFSDGVCADFHSFVSLACRLGADRSRSHSAEKGRSPITPPGARRIYELPEGLFVYCQHEEAYQGPPPTKVLCSGLVWNGRGYEVHTANVLLLRNNQRCETLALVRSSPPVEKHVRKADAQRAFFQSSQNRLCLVIQRAAMTQSIVYGVKCSLRLTDSTLPP